MCQERKINFYQNNENSSVDEKISILKKEYLPLFKKGCSLEGQNLYLEVLFNFEDSCKMEAFDILDILLQKEKEQIMQEYSITEECLEDILAIPPITYLDPNHMSEKRRRKLFPEFYEK